MFLDKRSRYAKVGQVSVVRSDGQIVTAVKLRRLPPTLGDPRDVVQGDQLDVMAQDKYADPTRFWHIADANTALEANELVAEPGSTLRLPRS